MEKKKYKILPIVLAVMVMISAACIPSSKVMAETVYVDSSAHLKYTVDINNNATITGVETGIVLTGAFSIPDKIGSENYNVTSVGDNAFYSSLLTSITIPDSVTIIGSYAFDECRLLTSITIPDSVTSIGSYAFWNCIKLTSITIPDSVTSIGDCAFQGCFKLASITIPDSVTSIGALAFQNCGNLTSVAIGNSLANINPTSFNECYSLAGTRITIYQNPNDTSTLMTIGSYTDIQLNPTIANKIAPITNGTATVTDYTNLGITGVTADNLDAVNSAVASAKNIAGAGIILTKSQIQKAVTNGVATLQLTQNVNTLTAQLKKSDGTAFTTTSAVTYKWYRNDTEISGQTQSTYALTNDDKGASIKAKVNEYGLQSNSIYIPEEPIVTMGTVNSVSTDTATLTVTVKANGADTTVVFKYGTTTSCDQSVTGSPSLVTGTGATSVSAVLSSLTPNTLYYYIVVGSNAVGISNDLEGIFTTAQNSYTVTFKDYDGTIIGIPQTIVEGQAAIAVTAPVRAGYTFTGWDKTFTNITQNIVVTATYTQDIPNNPLPVTTPPAVIIPSDDDETTTPAAVTIKGTQRVGKTLEAILLTNAGAQVTTSSGVTYEWYRLSNKNSNGGVLVGSDKTYNIVSSDKDNYIKLIATYNGQEFVGITGAILKRSSGSNSSSSSSSSSNDDSNSSANTPPVIVKPVQIANGWQKQSDGTWKYSENGQYINGWKQIDGLWYLFDLSSTMQRDWKQDDNKWYYLGSDGVMRVGWELINGKWYLFKISGEMITGWAQMDDKWYYLNSDGSMATGWTNVNGKWYYLYGDGSLAVNTTINGYDVDENGAWIN